MTLEDNWQKVKDHFLKNSDVEKRGESLKTQRKMFAMLNKGTKFVLKLPKERVTELINSGKGKPYDPGNGKIMKEWVEIPLEYSDEWIDITTEAKAFARSLAK